MGRMQNKLITVTFVVLSVLSLAVVMLDSLGRSILPVRLDSSLTGEEPHVPADAFCVTTYNIAHGRGTALHQLLVRKKTIERNLRAVAEYVKAVSPDVAGFQEVDVDCNWSGNFNHAEFIAECAGFAHCRYGVNNVNEGGYKLNYGNAVISRHPVARFENHPFGDASLGEKGFLVADIEMKGRVVTFAVAHLDFRTAKNRTRQVQKMIEVLKGIDGPLVVMGDFNYDLTGTEESLRLLVEALSLTTWTPRRGTGATFPAKRPATRIDYIFITDDLEFVACASPAKHLTDHLPVIAVIKFKKQ